MSVEADGLDIPSRRDREEKGYFQTDDKIVQNDNVEYIRPSHTYSIYVYHHNNIP